MCKLYCFSKLAELSKKHKLKAMIDNNCTDMFGNKLDVKKIKNFIKNADCCKDCVYNTK